MMGAGPFFLADMDIAEQRYRGRPSSIKMRIAVFYLGDLEVEIIAQSNDEPSQYREALDRCADIPAAGLFHHYGIATDNFDTSYKRHLAQGGTEAWLGVFPPIGRVAYIDAVATAGCYLEIFEPSVVFDNVRLAMKNITKQWDGRDIRRPLESAFS